MNDFPILSTIPRSGTWFLRYSISFLCHLDRGGRIDDRLTGEIVGSSSGPTFDFQQFNGGPLFHVQGTLPSTRLFIGHTVCPGFADIGGKSGWWPRTSFHSPGYDYLHEGMNYKYTPTELAPDRYTPVNVPKLDRAARKGRGSRIALIYRNPVDQAASYYRYCQGHSNPSFRLFKGQPLGSVPFHDYLFGGALRSYAKQYISFQAMAAKYPAMVRLVPYERLMRRPLEVMTGVLDHLAATPAPGTWPMLGAALRLARSEHLRAVEQQLGHSLDGSRRGSHMWQGEGDRLDGWADSKTCSEAASALSGMGIDPAQFEWPTFSKAATAA